MASLPLYTESSERRPILPNDVYDIEVGTQKDLMVGDWKVSLSAFEPGKVRVSVKGKATKILDPEIISTPFAYEALNNPYYYAKKDAMTFFYADPITLVNKVDAILDKRLASEYDKLYLDKLIDTSTAAVSTKVTVSAPVKPEVISQTRLETERYGMSKIINPLVYKETMFTKWGGWILAGIAITIGLLIYDLLNKKKDPEIEKLEKIQKSKKIAQEAIKDNVEKINDLNKELGTLSGSSTIASQLGSNSGLGGSIYGNNSGLGGSNIYGGESIPNKPIPQVSTVEELNVGLPGKDLLLKGIDKVGDIGIKAVEKVGDVGTSFAQGAGAVLSTVAPSAAKTGESLGKVVQQGLSDTAGLGTKLIGSIGDNINSGIETAGDVKESRVENITKLNLAKADINKREMELEEESPIKLAEIQQGVPYLEKKREIMKEDTKFNEVLQRNIEEGKAAEKAKAEAQEAKLQAQKNAEEQYREKNVNLDKRLEGLKAEVEKQKALQNIYVKDEVNRIEQNKALLAEEQRKAKILREELIEKEESERKLRDKLEYEKERVKNVSSEVADVSSQALQKTIEADEEREAKRIAQRNVLKLSSKNNKNPDTFVDVLTENVKGGIITGEEGWNMLQDVATRNKATKKSGPKVPIYSAFLEINKDIIPFSALVGSSIYGDYKDEKGRMFSQYTFTGNYDEDMKHVPEDKKELYKYLYEKAHPTVSITPGETVVNEFEGNQETVKLLEE